MDDAIGTRIAEARERAGLNRNQLARALGTAWQHVDHWEKGRTRPTLESVRKIAEVLQVPVESLLGLRELGPSAGYERFLEDHAPADLSEAEAEWLEAVPLPEESASADAYRSLLTELRRVASPPRSGTRRKVDPSRLQAAIDARGEEEAG